MYKYSDSIGDPIFRPILWRPKIMENIYIYYRNLILETIYIYISET